MESNGHKKSISDHYVLIKRFGDDDFIILLLCVNDILIIGHDGAKIENLKKNLNKSML